MDEPPKGRCPTSPGTRKRTAKGTDKLRFSGRLAGRTRGAGRYRLRLVATDGAKNHSLAATATFTIKRG